MDRAQPPLQGVAPHAEYAWLSRLQFMWPRTQVNVDAAAIRLHRSRPWDAENVSIGCGRGGEMAFLNVCFYLLASFALLDYLGKLFYERLSEWQEARQLVGGHPEMCGVDLERDDLIYFKADDAIREAVLGNDEAGTNDPFLGDLFLLDEDGF